MRFILTAFWSIVICSAVSYILANMGGQEFNGTLPVIIGLIFALAVFILGEGILTDPEESREA